MMGHPVYRVRFCLLGGRGLHVEVVVDGMVVEVVVDGIVVEVVVDVAFVVVCVDPVVIVVVGVVLVVVLLDAALHGHCPLSSPFRLMMNFLSRCALRTSALASPVALPFHSGSGLEKYMIRLLYASVSYLWMENSD